MARPSKNNAEYFPHYAGVRNHRKVKVIRNKFGQVLGYAFWSMMLEWLIEHDGLEWEYSEIEIEMFASELGVSATEIREMVDFCIKLQLLTQTNSGFIYSESLNENLQPVFEKRKRERDRSKERIRKEDGTFSGVKRLSDGVSAAEIPHSKEEKSKEKKSNKKDVRFDPKKLDLPFTGDDLKASWINWCDHKSEIKNPITEQSSKQQINKLKNYPEPVAIGMINKAIEKGWRGLFELEESEIKSITMSKKSNTTDTPRRRYLNEDDLVPVNS